VLPRITGFVDGVHKGDVVGWIINHEDPGRLEEILCSGPNGLIRFHAFRDNPGVSAAVQCEGRFGFAIPIAQIRHLGPVIEFRTRHDTLLEQGELDLAAHPPQPKGASQSAIIFLHIPKAAGTSITSSLSETLPLSASAAIYHRHPWLSARDFATLYLHERRGFRFIYGHLTYGFHGLLGQPARYATILREPLRRIESHYWHMRRTLKQPLLEGTPVPHSAIVNAGLLDEFDNIQTRTLSGAFQDLIPLGAVSDTDVDLALYNVASHFEFVGFYETLHQDYPRLCDVLGVATPGLRKYNIHNYGCAEDTDFQQLDWDRIAHNNRFDIALYRALRQTSDTWC
jgi:hypothetical protein